MVAAAIERADGHILMHRRPIHKQHGGLWEFPGGKVEDGEAPVSALIRELNEELGIAVPARAAIPLSFAQEYESERNRWIVILLYTVREWQGNPTALEDGGAVDWFPPGDLASLDRPPLDVALCSHVFPRQRR